MEGETKSQVALNNAWAIFESLCEENHNTATEGKLTFKFLDTTRTRLTRFEQWGDHCLRTVQQARNSTDPQEATLTKAIGDRWSQLGSLLGSLQVLERERVSLLHAIDILPDDSTLVPSLDAEHPRIRLGRRITLLELNENIVISELGAVSKRIHKVDSEPKKAAQRLWAEKVIEIRKEQSGESNYGTIGYKFDIEKAHAILEENDEAFDKISRESQQWCIARTYFENYAQAVTMGYKSLNVFGKNYQPGESFSGDKLKQWKTLSAIVEGETCFVAGSLHLGEGRFALDVFSELRTKAEGERPLLLVAPNLLEAEEEPESHSQAGIFGNFIRNLSHLFSRLRTKAEDERPLVPVAPKLLGIREELQSLSQERESGYSIRNLSRLSVEDKGKVDVIIIDTWGMLYDVYSLGSGAIVGGTFLANRHHSYVESLLWGVPVFTGYHQHDQECVIELVNKGTEKLVHQVSVDEASAVAEEWVKHLSGGMPESIRIRNQLSFIKQIASVEPNVYEAFQWLRPELVYWIKELAANDRYDECPCIDELVYLHIIWLEGKVSPWILELLEKYESDNSVSLLQAIENSEQKIRKS